MTSYFWIFLFYSFLGFLLEVAFARATHGEKQDRKCLYVLPLCPVYGLGAVAILILPEPVRQSWPLLFLCGGAAALLVEYLYSFAVEQLFGVHFWDYSNCAWNLKGRVCLDFGLIWGALAVGLVRFHPHLAPFLDGIEPGVTLLAVPCFLMDCAVTFVVLRRGRSTEVLRWYQHRGTADVTGAPVPPVSPE